MCSEDKLYLRITFLALRVLTDTSFDSSSRIDISPLKCSISLSIFSLHFGFLHLFGQGFLSLYVLVWELIT